MVEGRGGSVQGADSRQIRNRGVALLRDRQDVGRRHRHAAGDPASPIARIFIDAQRAGGTDAVRRLPYVGKELEQDGKMTLPSFQQLMLPALQTLGLRHEEISIAGLEDEVVKSLRISSEVRARMLPSGNQTVFANRLNWARSYLSKAGLIELPRRGYCRATDRGRELLAEGINEINLGLLERYPEFIAWRAQKPAQPDAVLDRCLQLLRHMDGAVARAHHHYVVGRGAAHDAGEPPGRQPEY